MFITALSRRLFLPAPGPAAIPVSPTPHADTPAPVREQSPTPESPIATPAPQIAPSGTGPPAVVAPTEVTPPSPPSATATPTPQASPVMPVMPVMIATPTPSFEGSFSFDLTDEPSPGPAVGERYNSVARERAFRNSAFIPFFFSFRNPYRTVLDISRMSVASFPIENSARPSPFV